MMKQTPADLGSGRKVSVLAIILAVSVLLRLAASFYLGNTVEVLPGTYDQISYNALALRVLDGHGFTFATASWPLTAAGAPTAHWSFLYTLYLTAVYALFGPNPLVARLIQATIVGILHPFIVYLIGQRIFGRRAGLLAAGFTAIYIYFIYYAATLMTEPFYITGILASLYLLLRLADAATRKEALWLAVGVGLTLGATALFRQLFLMIIPFLLLWLWAARYLAARRRAMTGGRPDTNQGLVSFLRSRAAPWGSSVLIIGIVLLMILPFTFYNTSRFDRFVLLNTNAGYAFFWANHPVYGTRFVGILPPELGSYQDLIPEELRNLDEPALEQALMTRGLQFVLDDPGRYVLLSLSRIPVYFMFWPSPESGLISNVSRVGSFALFLPLMIGGVLFALIDGDTRRRTLGQTSLLLLFMVAYAGIHIASWALIRYRLPVDAVLLVFAGQAATELLSRIRRRQSERVAVGGQT